MDRLTIHFSATDTHSYHLRLESPDVGEYRGDFAPPYAPTTWQAILLALEPFFSLNEADPATQAALEPLGDIARLHQTVGVALANAVLADDKIRSAFDVALGIAEGSRQPLPVELQFGQGSDPLVALPWELLYHKGRFIVADTSIALSRYPAGTVPLTPALAELPLRVLLVLSEPVGASPIFSQRAREELTHGLRRLDEKGAVIVDLLRPPTFDTLIEATSNGGYHMFAFYGHGAYEPDNGGLLLFEDEFGGPALVKASELGLVLHNTGVRLVLLGACQSAQVGGGAGEGEGSMWRGTAPALLRAGVPLAIGMQVNMRVDAALAFIRQFTLSLAIGKSVIEAVGDARKPLIRDSYGRAWFIPALYGRPIDDYRLFDPALPLPGDAADLRAAMKRQRAEIERLEKAITGVSVVRQPGEIVKLREVRRAFVETRAELARHTPGGYASVTSPLYGVPSNPVFVGRAAEMHKVGQTLRGDQPVIIWGAAGIGKTALAIEVAHRQSWRFPAGVVWLDCRGGPVFDTLLDQIGAFCGREMELVELDKKEAVVRWALAELEGRCLLIWDNAEDVWGQREVRGFIENLPSNCQALLTTRENPERPMWPTIELSPLVDEAMAELFYQLASSANVKIGSQADRDAIPHVIDWLQGHPLALTLVVPLIRKRGIKRVWADLQTRPLKGIQAAFEVSYERLSETRQRLFAGLSVFTIPFEWDAAEALLPEESEVEDSLDVLVQQALINFDGARYAYHALLRQYAYDKLRTIEDVRPVHRLAAEYLEAKITDKERGGTPNEWLERVDQWEWAEAWEEFAYSAAALVGRVDRVGYWADIWARLKRAQAVVKDHLGSPPDLEAGLLNNMANMASKRGEWDEAIGLLKLVTDLYQAIGDKDALARTYNNLGAICESKGEWDQAIEFLQQSLAIQQQMGDCPGLAHTYVNLGNAYRDKGQWEKAIEFYQESLAIREQLGDREGLALTYNNLGIVHHDKGEWDQAIEYHKQSLAIYEKLNDRLSLVTTYSNLIDIYKDRGEWEQAIEFYQQLLPIYDQLGDLPGLARAYSYLGNIYKDKGEWEKAINFLEKSLDCSERLGDIHGVAKSYGNLGNVYRNKGEWGRAIDFHQKSLDIHKLLGAQKDLAHNYMNLGNIHAQEGQWVQAIKYYQESLAIREQIGDQHGLAQVYVNLGNAYQGKEEWEQAIECYEQAFPIMERLGDLHGMALGLMNMGRLLLYTGRADAAKPLFARAYSVLAQLGSPQAQVPAQALIHICGSVEAANAYVAETIEGKPIQSATRSPRKEGITPEQLLGDVVRVCLGDAALGQSLWRLTQQIAGDPNQPTEMRTLGQILNRILAGEREPDLSALPSELARAVQEMLNLIERD